MAQILRWERQSDRSWHGLHDGVTVAVVGDILDLDLRESPSRTHTWDVIGVGWGQSNCEMNAWRAAEAAYFAEIARVVD